MQLKKSLQGEGANEVAKLVGSWRSAAKDASSTWTGPVPPKGRWSARLFSECLTRMACPSRWSARLFSECLTRVARPSRRSASSQSIEEIFIKDREGPPRSRTLSLGSLSPQ
eukprot:587992-Pyramimonas_sp.AAC.1